MDLISKGVTKKQVSTKFKLVENLYFNEKNSEAHFDCDCGKFKLQYRILEDQVVPLFTIQEDRLPISYIGKSPIGEFNSYLPYIHSKDSKKLGLLIESLVKAGSFSFEVEDDIAMLKFEINDLSNETLYETVKLAKKYIPNEDNSKHKGEIESIVDCINQKEDRNAVHQILDKYEENIINKINQIGKRIDDMGNRHRNDIVNLRSEMKQVEKSREKAQEVSKNKHLDCQIIQYKQSQGYFLY